MVIILHILMRPFVVIGVPIPVIIGGHHLALATIVVWQKRCLRRVGLFLLLFVVVVVVVVVIAYSNIQNYFFVFSFTILGDYHTEPAANGVTGRVTRKRARYLTDCTHCFVATGTIALL